MSPAGLPLLSEIVASVRLKTRKRPGLRAWRHFRGPVEDEWATVQAFYVDRRSVPVVTRIMRQLPKSARMTDVTFAASGKGRGMPRPRCPVCSQIIPEVIDVGVGFRLAR